MLARRNDSDCKISTPNALRIRFFGSDLCKLLDVRQHFCQRLLAVFVIFCCEVVCFDPSPVTFIISCSCILSITKMPPQIRLAEEEDGIEGVPENLQGQNPDDHNAASFAAQVNGVVEPQNL